MSTYKIDHVETVYSSDKTTGTIRVYDFNGESFLFNQKVPADKVDVLWRRISDAGVIQLQYWTKEAQQVTKCHKCNGTGIYMLRKGPDVCYACKGKGVQNPSDRARCSNHGKYAMVQG